MNKMEEQNIRGLLSKSAEGLTLTSEEEEQLETWYDAFPEHEDLTFVSEADKKSIGSSIKQNIFSRMGVEVPVVEPMTKRGFVLPELILRVAVAILILILGGWAWLWYTTRAEKAEAVKIISVVAPPGNSTLKIYLPDSSRVALYPGTTIRYPQHFSNHKREVQLIDGIAFFEIKHNKQAPFIVKSSGGLSTEVLGTQFNIKDYKNLPQVEITLVQGSLKILASGRQIGILRPNQQIRYNKASRISNLYEINPARYTSGLQGQAIQNQFRVQ